MVFTEAERTYLAGQHLGRLATVDADSAPQLRPLGFRLNADGTIDLGGPAVARTQRYRNVRSNPKVAFVVDDMASETDRVKPGWGRGVEVRGTAETLAVDDPPGVDPALTGRDIIRIHPERIHSWHIDKDNPDGGAHNVNES